MGDQWGDSRCSGVPGMPAWWWRRWPPVRWGLGQGSPPRRRAGGHRLGHGDRAQNRAGARRCLRGGGDTGLLRRLGLGVHRRERRLRPRRCHRATTWCGSSTRATRATSASTGTTQGERALAQTVAVGEGVDTAGIGAALTLGGRITGTIRLGHRPSRRTSACTPTPPGSTIGWARAARRVRRLHDQPPVGRRQRPADRRRRRPPRRSGTAARPTGPPPRRSASAQPDGQRGQPGTWPNGGRLSARFRDAEAGEPLVTRTSHPRAQWRDRGPHGLPVGHRRLAGPRALGRHLHGEVHGRRLRHPVSGKGGPAEPGHAAGPRGRRAPHRGGRLPGQTGRAVPGCPHLRHGHGGERGGAGLVDRARVRRRRQPVTGYIVTPRLEAGPGPHRLHQRDRHGAVQRQPTPSPSRPPTPWALARLRQPSSPVTPRAAARHPPAPTDVATAGDARAPVSRGPRQPTPAGRRSPATPSPPPPEARPSPPERRPPGTGLANGTAYAFTVTATSRRAPAQPASVASAPVPRPLPRPQAGRAVGRVRPLRVLGRLSRRSRSSPGSTSPTSRRARTSPTPLGARRSRASLGPVLLTRPTGLPAAIRWKARAAQAKKIVVLGSDGVVSTEVQGKAQGVHPGSVEAGRPRPLRLLGRLLRAVVHPGSTWPTSPPAKTSPTR